MRPPEEMVETGHDEQKDKDAAEDALDHLLARFLFRGRAGAEPVRNQLRIVIEKIRGGRNRRAREDQQVEPRLPAGERQCGQDQTDGESSDVRIARPLRRAV